MVYNACLGQKIFTIGLPAECDEDKTVTIGDETGALILNLQLATNPLIRVGAILRLFNILVKSNHLHFTTTSLVDTAINIASKGVQDLTTEPEPWFTAEVVQIS